jgi:hypothetical protein
MRAIETCRTPIQGGHLDVCDTCGHTRPAYNSCRNRHCPKCQALAQARWVHQRLARLLPTPYFHVVFTLPAALRPLALHNRKRVFALLFQAAAQTLLTLGRDPARLGGQLGVTAVLHTWTRELQFHPHLHCIVTGGGLAPAGTRWMPARRRYLFPVRVLSRLFRGKFLAALADAYRAGTLACRGRAAALADPHAFHHLRAHLARTDWIVYAKRPFAGTAHVFHYLGRYTHRVGLSNHRLQHVDATAVRFATKHGKAITLAHHEFIRRFLLHVLPAGFVKIRHYGLFAPRHATTTLARARRALEDTTRVAPPRAPAPRDWRALLALLTGRDLSRCPRCHRGTMIAQSLSFGVLAPTPRAPPALAAA